MSLSLTVLLLGKLPRSHVFNGCLILIDGRPVIRLLESCDGLIDLEQTSAGRFFEHIRRAR